MQTEINDILEKSLQKAREHDRIGNLGKAYAYYTIVVELYPSKRSEIEETFTDILCKITMILNMIFKVISYKIIIFNFFRQMGNTVSTR